MRLVTNKDLQEAIYEQLKHTKEVLNLFNNPNRRQIYELVRKEKGLNISDISKKVKLSYQNTFAHVKKLEEYGLIRTEKQEKEKGRSVRLFPTKKTYNALLSSLTKP